MKYRIEITKRCEKDIKKYKKKHYNMDIFLNVVRLLQNDDKEILRSKYRDHALKGEWYGFRELHLDKDWLLVYRKVDDRLILTLTRMRSHDDLGLV